MNLSDLVFNQDGLIPAIVQDFATRRVLMMGYMNAESLATTLETGRVTFWSRRRQQLWEKGETSGNTLELVEILPDCDSDTLLVIARPKGPTCHTGSDTCWGQVNDSGFARLENLWSVISQRAAERPEGSYTVRLIEEGPDLPSRKLSEEAVEVLMAAKDHSLGKATDRRVAEEMADVIYHLLVLAAERNIDPALIMEVLADREK